MKEKLLNGNKWCHIYTDDSGMTNIYNTETNETYRIVPDPHFLGFAIERYVDGEMEVRNIISFDEMKILSNLAGSNDLLKSLSDKGGEQK